MWDCGLRVRTHGTHGSINLIVKLRQKPSRGTFSSLGFYTLAPIRDTACFSLSDRDARPLPRCQPGLLTLNR